MRLIGRIDEKNFLILKISLSNEHYKWVRKCLRMPKTKAQRQSIAKAVQQTATFTTSILLNLQKGYKELNPGLQDACSILYPLVF